MCPKWIVVLVVQIVVGYGQGPALDSRCYLENGGSAENFIVSEDIRVNSVIGQLKINGDASPNGNIKLSLVRKLLFIFKPRSCPSKTINCENYSVNAIEMHPCKSIQEQKT